MVIIMSLPASQRALKNVRRTERLQKNAETGFPSENATKLEYRALRQSRETLQPESHGVPLRRQPMSSRSMRMALLMTAFALMPVALWAQTATDVAAPKQVAALESSNSTLNVPIEDIAATLAGCAILDKDFPGLRAHTMYHFFKTMSLNQIAAMSHGQITADMLVQAQADLSALPIKAIARSVYQTDGENLDFAPTAGHGSRSNSAHK
jgi:hypothetical protein